MNTGFRNRWLIFGAFAVASLALMTWNSEQAASIVETQLQQENIRRTDIFLRQHAEKIPRLEKELEYRIQKVENQDLAILYVEREILRLAEKAGLQELRINSNPVRKLDQCAEINLEGWGALARSAQLLEALESNIPYLQVLKFSTRTVDDRDRPRTNLSLEYRCKPPASPATPAVRGLRRR